MTLMYELDLDILKAYLLTKNEVSRSRLSKLEHKQNRQTDTTIFASGKSQSTFWLDASEILEHRV